MGELTEGGAREDTMERERLGRRWGRSQGAAKSSAKTKAHGGTDGEKSQGGAKSLPNWGWAGKGGDPDKVEKMKTHRGGTTGLQNQGGDGGSTDWGMAGGCEDSSEPEGRKSPVEPKGWIDKA